jgi:hypothetical protein
MNIIRAIINIVNCPSYKTKDYVKSRNRINNMGEALELFIMDAFSGAFYIDDVEQAQERYFNAFSYKGNQNNPPDLILKGGDAIEVKKIESSGSALALNSSYPKAKLYSDSPMITYACKNCENWVEKDIIYAVGVVKDNQISHLCFVYGIDYAASRDVYERIKDVIKTGVSDIQDVEFSETNELGRVNKVDPLGITYLRVRGMWHIENPIKLFSYVYQPIEKIDFKFFAIINNDKFNTFDEKDIKELKECKNLSIKDIKIKEPDNPARLKDAKLITYLR